MGPRESSYNWVERLTKVFLGGSTFLKGKDSESDTPLPRCLLVDEDMGYGRMLMVAAGKERIPLNHMRSIQDAVFLSEWKFDVAIVHQELGALNGASLMERLEPLLGGIPVVLLTDYAQADPGEYPPYVKKCLPKTAALTEILGAAMEAYILGRK